MTITHHETRAQRRAAGRPATSGGDAWNLRDLRPRGRTASWCFGLSPGDIGMSRCRSSGFRSAKLPMLREWYDACLKLLRGCIFLSEVKVLSASTRSR